MPTTTRSVMTLAIEPESKKSRTHCAWLIVKA